MKVKINDNESYAINLPDEVDREQFIGIVERMSALMKIFGRDAFLSTTGTVQNGMSTQTTEIKVRGPQDKDGWDRLRADRQLVVDVLKAYYKTGNETWEQCMDRVNLSVLKRNKYIVSTVGFRKISREIHQIQPAELGLSQWPNNAKIDSYRL